MSIANEIAEEIMSRYHHDLKDRALFASFYLQELDGAKNGNKDSKAWVKSKGFDQGLYKNALHTDDESADNIQMALAMKIMSSGTSSMSKLKRDVVDIIYERYVTDADK
jgi:hypothetical protein